MQLTIFDIETAPDPDKVRELHSFDPSSVAIGNRGPEKAAEYVREKEAEFWAKKHDKAALNPLTARVCAWGMQWESVSGRSVTYTYGIKETHPEAVLLAAFWDTLNQRSQAAFDTQFVGWCSSSFDLPMLIQRSWINGVCVPEWVFDNGRVSGLFVDLMKRWTCYQYGEYAKLSTVAKVLGVARPRAHEVEGKDFWKVAKEDPQRASAYLIDDLAETWDVAERLLMGAVLVR